MKKYIEVKATRDASHLKIEVYYNLGGFNCFTYRNEQRGYYLSVTPVKRENRNGCTMEQFTAFTGIKQLVKPVNRKSTKAEAEAEAIAATMEADLIRYVCNKNGLEVNNAKL